MIRLNGNGIGYCWHSGRPRTGTRARAAGAGWRLQTDQADEQYPSGETIWMEGQQRLDTVGHGSTSRSGYSGVEA